MRYRLQQLLTWTYLPASLSSLGWGLDFWGGWICSQGVARTWSSRISAPRVWCLLELICNFPLGSVMETPSEQCTAPGSSVLRLDQTPWDQTMNPRTKHLWGPDPPSPDSPWEQCVSWQQMPPLQADPPLEQNSWHTLLKILPCPKLRLWAVNIFHYYLWVGICSMKSMVIDTLPLRL